MGILSYSSWLLWPRSLNVRRGWLWVCFGSYLGLTTWFQCHLLQCLSEHHLPAPTCDRVWQTGSVSFLRSAFACFHPCSCVFAVTFLGRPWHWYWSCPEGEQCMSWNTKLDFNVISNDAISPCISHHHHKKAEARQCCLATEQTFLGTFTIQVH